MFRSVLTGAAVCALFAAPALGEDFYKGKTMKIITSTGVGGSYDTIARAVARMMPQYIAGNPTIIVQNMPGGGNLLATNFMYVNAPQDGTVLATINNAIPLHQAMDGGGVRFDARKFNWLGSTGNSNSVTIAWHTAGVKSIADVKKKEIVLGGTGPASSIVIFPTVMNKVLGTKFKIVTGYKSSNIVDLALDRGEILARSGSYESIVSNKPDWIKEKKIVFLVQVGPKREKDLPDVPLLTELAETDDQRQILKLVSSPILLGRPFLAPPNVPADRVALLRKAFASTMADKNFLNEAGKQQISIDPVSGEEIAQRVNETINAPDHIRAAAKAVMPERKKKKKKE
ncbi:MAG: hypothetical protein RLZ98_2485 [Pseudomonadota bacterium]|jgi:tripartite-type tricarboxylate transporter receptor subunit TctC